MEQNKTPGVYVVEENAFPNSVVEVPTAVPVFIGYTQMAASGATDLTNVPTKISSFAEFEHFFGSAPDLIVTRDATSGDLTNTSPFLMHQGLRLFYDNGGVDCYIVSVGRYVTADGAVKVPDKDALTAPLTTLLTTFEPTMVLTPDSALMPLEEWAVVSRMVLDHCQRMQSRIAILDLVNGHVSPGQPTGPDPIRDFREKIGTNGLDYGVAYYPWLNTVVVNRPDITVLNLDDDLRAALAISVEAEYPDLKDLAAQILTVKTLDEAKILDQTLASLSPTYSATLTDACTAINIMPPSTAMAGVMTLMDNTEGPWVAPANTSITGVTTPTVNITNTEQENLNIPIDGKAVNAIRSFIGRGTLVWGARTLDGNSQDWRYVSVRRTMILIEQSTKMACKTFVFEANDANTWATLKAMLENFLTGLWTQGALVGAASEDAFSVSVGLGSTMTSDDILNGIMKVSLKVALSHPAEFMILTFQQEMQTS